MSAPTPAPNRRRTIGIVIAAVLAAAVVVFIVVGVVTATGSPRAGGTSGASDSAAPSSSAEPSSSASATSTVKAPPVVKASNTPTPQPTKTTALQQSAPITKSLTVKVTKVEAVTGVADGPGEIGGPSLRFTIAIHNTTGKSVSLTDTVVNAYYGTDSTPATTLAKPGAENFPTTVKNGATATGVFVFNVPTKQRSDVEVTVDTSVSNPVIAFRGSAPK